MEKTEILDNGEMWDVEPRAAADVAARFEALEAERRVHYAAMAAADVLPEEAPFPREREWRKLKDEIKDERLKIKEGVKGVATGVLTVLAIPGIGVFFGLIAAFAMIAEEGLSENGDGRPGKELRDECLELRGDTSKFLPEGKNGEDEVETRFTQGGF